MRWSIKLGRFAGIDVYVHITFSLLVAWIALSQWRSSHAMAAVLREVGFVLTVFLCIVLHEFGHALTARRYGIVTRDITLLPIGGVARLERMPDKPIQEFFVALAGPAVNVVIAACLALGLGMTGKLSAWSQVSIFSHSFLHRLLAVNLFIVLFNLLPAFPMDGGRVVRAFLASRMPYAKATAIAAAIGQCMAVTFAILGLYAPILLFIAFFVWIGASQESSAAEVKEGLQGVFVKDAMITDFQTLDAGDRLSRAIDLILAGPQHDFPVVDNGQVLGILGRTQLMVALAQHGRDWPVSQVMVRNVPALDAHRLVAEVITDLHNCECQTLPVMSEGRLVGLLTSENVGEFLMIRAALKPSNDTGFIRR